MSEMPRHERPLSEQFRLVAKKYAEVIEQYDFMKNTRTGTRARWVLEEMEKSNEKITKGMAELRVNASDKWFEFNAKLAALKARSEILRDQKTYLEAVRWERNNADANKRKEMGMSN